jgi:hypothetical protein
MLLLTFQEALAGLPKSDETEPITFTAADLPVIPDTLVSDGIEIESRQRYTTFGQIDNIVINLDKPHSNALGLWIMAATLQARHLTYELRLTADSSIIREIRINRELDERLGFYSRPEKFIWKPTCLQSFKPVPENYSHQRPTLYVTNAKGEWFSQEEYWNRDLLCGFGPPGGACMLAEFFLNFGLESSNLGYEYIKYEYGMTIADEQSCEARVVLFSAHGPSIFDDQQNTLH